MKKQSLADQLAGAQRQLTEVNAQLDKLSSLENAATETPDAYAEWKRSRDNVVNESERLQLVIQKIEADIIAHNDAKAKKQQLQIEAEADREADLAADTLAANLAEMVRLARETLATISAADAMVRKANAGRADDEDRLFSVEARARLATMINREILSSATVDLWTHLENSDAPIPAEYVAMIVSHDGRTGHIPPIGTDGRYKSPVIKRRFRRTEFLPAHRGRPDPQPLLDQLAQFDLSPVREVEIELKLDEPRSTLVS